MDLRQTQKFVQKLALTPQMKQSLRILQMPLLELKDYIEKEMEENPVIEKEIKESSEIPSLEESFLDTASHNEYQQYPIGDYANELNRIKSYRQNSITKEKTLQEILLQQLRMRKLSDKEYITGEFIIHYIDENGYLTLPVEEIISFLNNKNKQLNERITREDVENALSIIQSMEPAGIGARNLKECLIIQLKAKNKTNTLAYKIVEKYLSDVARNKIRVIARKLKVRLDKVKSAVKEISKLEPKPGRLYSFGGESRMHHDYPDVIIEKNKADYEIIINNPEAIGFKINPLYKNIIKSGKVPPETKKYIREKIKSALNLKKALSQRDSTLRSVAKCILDIQKDFFDHGDTTLLKPLTLKDVARMVKRNESTVSRVVNRKYVKTSHGIFKLNYFFGKPIKTNMGIHLSRESIKTYIYDIINEEDKKHPLNDTEISKLLRKERLNIARRTAAKYREELGIPPASKRRTAKKNNK